jgi:hypothetical protein
MSDVTGLTQAATSSDRKAAAGLLPLVKEELRKLAAVRLAEDAPGYNLNPTALVHEAYLGLVGPTDGTGSEGRDHFFAATEAMRSIAVASVPGWLRPQLRSARISHDGAAGL